MKRSLFSLLLFLSNILRAQPVDIVVQTGHNYWVKDAKFSKDGKYIASACHDGAIKLWDAKLGFEISTFYDFPFSYATGVAFSPDGKYLLSTGSDEMVVREISTGKKIAVIVGEVDEEKGGIGPVVFSPDGRYCFAGMEDHSVMRWEVDEFVNPEKFHGYKPYVPEHYANGPDDTSILLSPPASVFYYRGHEGFIERLFVLPGNKQLVSSAADGTIRVWDIATGTIIRLIKNDIGFSTVSITADGKSIITSDPGSSGKTILRTWDIATGRQVFSAPVKAGTLTGTDISPDGKWLAAGDLGKNIFIFSLPSFKLVRTITAHSAMVNCVAFSPDSKLILSGSDDKDMKLWEVSTGRLVKDFRKRIAGIYALTYENKHRSLTTAAKKGDHHEAITWEIDQGIGIKHHYRSNTLIKELAIDSSGQLLMLTNDSSIHFYSAVSGKMISIVPGIFANTSGLSPNTDFVFYQDYRDDSFYILKKGSDKPEFFAPSPTADSNDVFGDLTRIAFSPDGKIVAAGGGADIYLWEVETKQYIRNFNYVDTDSSQRNSGEYYKNTTDLRNATVNDLKFSPDGKLLAAACDLPDAAMHSGLIVIWEVATGKRLHWVQAHVFPINSLNWSPDGRYLISGSNDVWVKVWEYTAFKPGENTSVFEYKHDASPAHTSFTKDNKWMISAGIDGKIIIRDAITYKTIATLIGLDSNDYVAVTDEQYYAASKKGIQLIAFRQGNKIFPAEQFDIKYNRPDKVLEALGSADTNLINSYRQAYYKRIKKLGIDTSSFREGFVTPDFDFKSRDNISYQQPRPEIRLQVSGYDSISNLDRFNIWINEVPLYGQKGINLRNRDRNRFDTSITVKLSRGENRIETSVINTNGTESFRVPLLVNHTPPQASPELTYFIGVGIDEFADSQYNLKYSTKDIRDLAIKLKEKYGKNIVIDTLFNKNVTLSNIKRLKQKLQKSNENDRVIISYSGHGMLDKDFDYYLSTYAVNFEQPEQNGLPYDELENLLDNIPARKKLLLIDACHSGEVDKEDLVAINAAPDSLQLKKGLDPVGYKEEGHLGLKNSFELMQSLFVNVGKSTGATIISAAAGTQFALERNDLKNGVFTFSILEAMNTYPSMKISDLKKIVGKRVEELTNGLQKPTSRNETVAVDWTVW